MNRRAGALRILVALQVVVGLLVSVAPAAEAAGATRKVIISKAVQPTGSGANGTVTSRSNPTQTTQLNCGTLCTVSYSRYAAVTVVAAPDANSTLVGFSTNCTRSTTNTNECTIASLSADTTVTVTFARKQTLTVAKTSVESGSGSVTASAGAAFSDTCGTAPCTSTSNETYNSSVSLTATADASSRFMGWTWSGTTALCANYVSPNATCVVTMSAARSVSASFRRTYALTATKASTGGGAGTLTAAGTECAPSCTSRSISSESVTLSASASAGSVFSGWEGDRGTCTTASTCTLLMDQTRNVTARFTSLQTLTVTVDGTGSVTSTPAGISNCTTTCTASFPYNTTVSLAASSPESTRFSGWLGCTSLSASCSVTLTATTSVTASFGALNLLQAAKGGSGGGTVTAQGIDCGSDCYEYVTPGVSVTLTADPATGSRFDSWVGPCTGALTALTCTVPMDATTLVTANFVRVWNLAVTTSGSGDFGGSVAAGALTLGCVGNGCITVATSGNAIYDDSTLVTLVANPATDTSVTWSGDIGACDVHALSCQVTMDQARSITVTFAQIEFTVTATIAGSGDEFGSVTSLPAGIDCPSDCVGSYGIHGEVVLTAHAPAGSRFEGWTGPCTEGDPAASTCTVAVESAIDVTATFIARHVLTVVVDPGDGGGTVASDIGGIVCPDACTATYDEGTDVVLTATPDGVSRIISWSGGGCASGTSCTVDVAAATTVTVTLGKKIFTLSVTPTGSGSIASDVGGIDCGATCSATYAIGTTVTLHPVFDATAARFGVWGGACTGSESTCEVLIDDAKSVTASFVTIWPLTVAAASDGTGSGTVTSPEVGGIDCPSACQRSYDTGTLVTLTAHPSPTSMLLSWSQAGCPSSSLTCTATMDQTRSVTATFTKLLYPLSLTKTAVSGGTGTISIAAESYSCGPTCTSFSRNYEPGSSVTLSQSASANSWFVAWGGACAAAGLAETCTVSVDALTQVSATFEAMPVLTVTKAGVGSGTVTSTNLSGDVIDCGTDCTATVITNAVITLHAEPLASNGSTLTGWSIAGCGTSLDCDVAMSVSRTVTATFTAPTASISLLKTSQDSGSGSVTSSPAGISCTASGGSSCLRQAAVATYVVGTVVTLTAAPAADSYVVGWGEGQCDSVSADRKQCVVTVGPADTTRALTVTFGRPLLTVTKSSLYAGTGTVTGPNNVKCGTRCTATYTPDQVITLTATATTGSVFVRWAGDVSCAVTVATCEITMDRARSVTAVFGQGLLLSVAKTGNGLVYWAGNPALECGAICTTVVPSGTSVTLVASPESGWTFVRWEGITGCTTDAICTFTVTAATTVTAVFEPSP